MSKSILNQWIKEFNAPVIITVTTPEAERLCLKNGLLFHEMLSAFGHLDGINGVIRAGSQTFPITDAHIRFERNTESKAKSFSAVEKRLRDVFEAYDISKLPSNSLELKSSPPTAWNHQTEQIVTRLLSFSEYEMTSHPHLILTVVATSDIDPINAMHELVSSHQNTPSNLISTGQYDPSIVQRLYILLHDNADLTNNPITILKQLQTKFNSSYTKLLLINSFPAETPNSQQPDVWSRFMLPTYYPDDLPSCAREQSNNTPVLGCYLSIEDFMSLRNFCVELYSQWIMPSIERRIIALNKYVNEARKGMRNVLKSFWRKPRDESTETIKGIVKYKFDKIESQILFLADTSFMLRDLENALSMYKLVRDDFKADKSILHVAHTYLMIATCHMLLDPSHPKELFSDLEALAQVLLTNQENPFLNAYFAFLAAEMYVLNPSTRAPMEASKILLQAASSIGGNSILSALLTEKAARYLLQTHQVRKYVFYTVLSGILFLKCSPNAIRHAAVCFASVMLVIDKTNWIDLKGKLCHILSQDVKLNNNKVSAQRSLLLMLKMLNYSLCDDSDLTGTFTSVQLVNQSLIDLHEIIGVGNWGNISIQSTWEKLTIRQILLDPLPITDLDSDISDTNTSTITTTVNSNNATTSSYVEINSLSIPEVDISSTSFLHSTKGIETTDSSILIKHNEQSLAEEMYIYLNLENQWLEDQQVKYNLKNQSFNSIDTTTTNISISQMNEEVTLADLWVEKENELLKSRDSTKPINTLSLEDTLLRIPLGEEIKIKIKLSNKLCEDLQLNELKLIIEPENRFYSNEMNILMHQNSYQDVILTSKPLEYGQYKVNQLSWKLSDNFKVKQSLQKPGPLLQNSRQQRARGERGEDHSLSFIVVPPHPLLRITFEGLSAEVLQGQLLKSTLVLYNDGAATACDIIIKLSQPSFVFYVSDLIDTTSKLGGTTTHNRRNSFKEELITSCGGSSTLMRLASNIKILPGQSLRLEAWLMLNTIGIQKVSLLASYKALRDNGKKEVFGPGNLCRTSFVSIKTKVLPSLAISCRLLSKTSSIEHFTIMTDILNYLQNLSMNNNDNNNNHDDSKRERLSSLGQLDLSDLVTSAVGVDNCNSYNDIDENYFKIMGLWLLGAGVPFQYKQQLSTNSSNNYSSNNNNNNSSSSSSNEILVSPSTNVTKCFPIKLAIPSTSITKDSTTITNNNTSIVMNGKCSWLVPIPNMSATDIHLIRIIEQFLCIVYSSTNFIKEIENSRILSQAAELEAETLGPRSIAQVRREKLMQQLLLSNNSMKSQEEQSSILLLKNPRNVNDLANIFAKDFKILLTSIWICKWEGKLRWGLHQNNTISFIHKATITATTTTTTTLPSHDMISNNISLKTNASDYLLVSLQHNNHIILDNVLDSCCINVPVILKLRSICIEYLSVTVTAIDIVHHDNNENSLIASHDLSPTTHTNNHNTTTNNTDNNTTTTINKVTNNGCIWDGKTQYIGIILPPNAMKEIIINTLITKPGLYDLNKFKISVRFTNHENIHSSMKQIVGQSLIEVINK